MRHIPPTGQVSRARRIAAAGLLIQAVSLPVEIAAMIGSRAPYSPVHQTISDLAATRCTSIGYPSGPVEVCSPLHAALNASWLVAGLALVLAAIALRRIPVSAGRGRPRLASALLVVMGVSTVLTGLVPLDVDLVLHSLVSLPAILVGPSAVALAIVTWARREWMPAALVLAVLGTGAGIAVVLTLNGFGILGLLERFAVWTPVIGAGALGVLLVRGENWSERKHMQENSDEVLLDALAHTPAGTGEVDAREYRVLRAQAVKAIARASGIWDAAQGINYEFNERGRDFVHLPPELGPGLPPANPTHARMTTDLFILAIRCREIAHDAAWKYRFLARANQYAAQRADAMSTALGGGRGALDGLRGPGPAMEGDVLRARIVAAMASEVLSGQAQYASIDLHGLGGDLMVAWKYRTAAEGLEDVVSQISEMPQVAPAAMSEQGQVLLGDAADLSVPEVVWPEYGRLDHAVPQRAASELGERVDGVEPGDLRAGDRIVGAGGAGLSVAVDVVTDATSESVELAIEGPHVCFEVPLGLLNYHRGLSVRRPLVGEQESL